MMERFKLKAVSMLFKDSMMAIQFNVPDMSCGHCVSAITNAVQAVAPGASVTTDLATHRVIVDGASEVEVVRQAIVDAGYEPEVV